MTKGTPAGKIPRTPAQRREAFNLVVQHAMLDQGIHNQTQLGRLLGMKREAVCRRFNGVVDWQYPEISRLIVVLKIDAEGVAKMMGVAP